MKFIPILIPLIFITGMLTACQQTQTHNSVSKASQSSSKPDGTIVMSEKERQIVEALKWIQLADATDDAKAALKIKKPTEKPVLIAFSGRGKTFPGLSKIQYETIKDRVTYRYAEGSGDIIFGPTHKKLRRELRDYVSEYNQIIYKAVLSNSK